MPSMLQAAAATKLDLTPHSSIHNDLTQSLFCCRAQQAILSGNSGKSLPAVAAIEPYPTPILAGHCHTKEGVAATLLVAAAHPINVSHLGSLSPNSSCN